MKASKKIILFFLLTHCWIITAQQVEKKTYHKELEVLPNALIEIENQFGDLKMTSWDENRVVIEQEVTKRWQSDMNSDNWLSKSIRPLVLAWLVVSTTLLIFIDAGAIDFVVDDEWKSTITAILTITIGAYFGSRGLEKIKNK